MQTRSLGLIMMLFALLSCNKLQTAGEGNPITFSGITGIQASSDNSYILTWKIPFTVFIENYEVYVQTIQAADAEALIAAEASSSSDKKDETKTESTDVSQAVTVTDAFNPKSKGKLVALVSADRSSYRTASLDEGIYLFQVRALAAVITMSVPVS